MTKKHVFVPWNGMTVLDFGCGPGYFTIEIAALVGQSGRVFAVDLQEGMLQLVRQKIAKTGLETRIILHKCETDRIGLTDKVDFALVFYVLHEIPDQKAFFTELTSILKPGGEVLVVEPPRHVSKAGFAEIIEKAGEAGLEPVPGPHVWFSKTMVLRKI
jgi:ubiquinone/menaquinone biosynthesis C-methylase UbiE